MMKKLKLPLFPTTTIGSLPQSEDIRNARTHMYKGEWKEKQYITFIEKAIHKCISLQEAIGIDVLVHGEFERSDMVEYFGQSLEGFYCTNNGWVQSYGSRCVKPPILYGDVYRYKPITVHWSLLAKKQTKQPIKAILTGAVTIMQWSFVRYDKALETTALQIAFAIRDELLDIESAELSIIQIDEPALREALPLLHKDWETNLKWSIETFRISANCFKKNTQIHTHMCYSECYDILSAIIELDVDCISIEAARSNMQLLEGFKGFFYSYQIGPGIWDIHSTIVPPVKEIISLLKRAVHVLPVENLWVTPDCGLKTRDWNKTRAALWYLVSAANTIRSRKNYIE